MGVSVREGENFTVISNSAAAQRIERLTLENEIFREKLGKRDTFIAEIAAMPEADCSCTPPMPCKKLNDLIRRARALEGKS